MDNLAKPWHPIRMIVVPDDQVFAVDAERNSGGGRARRGFSGTSGLVETLRNDILSLRYKPGEALSRQALQTRFGLSSTPVRDALSRLAEEHLVEIYPQSGTIVTPIDLSLARQAQFLRRSLEMELLRTLGQTRPPQLIAQLRTLIQHQIAFAGLGAVEEFAGMDRNFHCAFYEAANTEDLWHMLRARSGHIDRLRRLHLPVEGKMLEIIKAHTDIVDALEAGDIPASQAALLHHLSRSLDFVPKLRADYPDYFRG